MATRLATYLNPGGDLAAAVDLARRAEALGYESVWVTHGLGRDSFLVLAAYGRVTSRLRLGNGVVPIYPRHPVTMAQAALTLSELTAGRFTLGIGVSHRASMDAMLGVPISAPLATMREYVAVLRGALGAGVDFDGKHYRAHWSLAVPTRPPAPPIYLAALGPKMCELAGEVADAVLFNFITPEYARTSGDLVRAGARKASRPVPTLYSYVRVALGAAARPRLQDEADRYGQIPAYAANFARMGVKPIDTTIMAETPAALHAAIARWDGVVDELVLRAITPADTVEQTLALVRAARPPA